MIYLTQVVLMLALGALQHTKQARPFVIYGTASGLYFLFFALVAIIAPVYPMLVWSFSLFQPDTTGMQRGTSYIALRDAIFYGAALLVPVVLWLEDRAGRTRFAALYRILFWPILLGSLIIPAILTLLLSNTQMLSALPRGALFALSDTTVIIALCCGIVVLALALISLTRRSGPA